MISKNLLVTTQVFYYTLTSSTPIQLEIVEPTSKQSHTKNILCVATKQTIWRWKTYQIQGNIWMCEAEPWE